MDALNQGARDLLRQSGQLGEMEIICSTQRGRVAFAEGDRIQLTTTDKSQGLMNGTFGIIEKIDLKTKNITIHLDNGEIKDLNPNTYDGLRHGYAATVYKNQGATLSSVYSLHSKTTTQATNYVSLTRQTKSLSLYVSQDETPSPGALIHQMERQQEKGTSLMFDTLKAIEKQNAEKTFFSPIKETAGTLVTKVKDKFHRNEAFYQFEKEKNLQKNAVLSVSQKPNSDRAVENKLEQEASVKTSAGAQEVLSQITRNCERLLYNHIAEKNLSLSPELKERIPLQAERAANFIFYAPTLQGTNPTEKETKRFLARAKYELDRIPQIKERLNDEWHKHGKFNKTSSSLMIHMIAERQASIEGRLFLEARAARQKPSQNISKLAEAEFSNNRAQAKLFAQQLKVQSSLSEDAAKECARNILRHQETPGEKPADTQRATMAEIAPNAYIKLKRYKEAQELLEKNLIIYRKNFSPSHDGLIRAMIYLTDAYMGLENYKKARPLLEETLLGMKQRHGKIRCPHAPPFRHLNNIFREEELEKSSTIAKFATVRWEGKRQVNRDIEFHNLDAIISVG